MNVLFQDGRLILRAETDAEQGDLATWKAVHAGHVLLAQVDAGTGLSLRDLGPQAFACREPLNVLSTHADPQIRILSNFAPTPFVLEDQPYNSVEGFWQGLKFADEADRRRLALADARQAKHAGEKQAYGEFVVWKDRQIHVGSREHWRLMEEACWAKFTQNEDARNALLGTAPRWLTHKVRHDSRAIPGVIMADIWMRIRDKLIDATDAP